jgi:predicted 2-oxoglutarate/Fe(II)-dependent dioxygenase YbiX
MNLDHFIHIEPNILPMDVCDALLDEYASTSEWVASKTLEGVNLNTRNCDTIKMSFAESIALNESKRTELDGKLFNALSQAAQTYFAKIPRAVCRQDTGYELLRYTEGGFYKEHTDYSPATPRQISFSFGLNDDYTGGEFSFFGGSKQYRLAKGSCIIFPSSFLYPHQILPVTFGTRYSVVTWMH